MCEAIRLTVEEGVEGEVAATRPAYTVFCMLHVFYAIDTRRALAPKRLILMSTSPKIALAAAHFLQPIPLIRF